jgi:hypothetical protein
MKEILSMTNPSSEMRSEFVLPHEDIVPPTSGLIISKEDTMKPNLCMDQKKVYNKTNCKNNCEKEFKRYVECSNNFQIDCNNLLEKYMKCMRSLYTLEHSKPRTDLRGT